MEKQDQNTRSWDDLIFENRNKAYGAYALRQDYSNRLLKGLLVSVGFATVLLATAGLLKESKIIDIPITLPDIVIGSAPVIHVEATPQTPRSEPVRQTTRNMPPVAVPTPDPVEPTEEPATTSTGTEGTPDGTATPDNGTSGNVIAGTDLGAVPVKSNEPFIRVEVMPEYKGGMEGMIKTLQRYMKYPASARRMGKEGTVFVEFVVSDKGEIKDLKVLRGFDLDCDKEAVRIVEKLIDWKPGFQNKLAVNVKLVMPVKFKLAE